MSTIAFIGLGVMGTPIALNLLDKGHELTVFARRPEAMRPLVDRGALAAASPREAAARSDVTITMVIDTSAVEDVLFGPEGVAMGVRAGSVVIDHTTIAPRAVAGMAERLQRQGVGLLDAPVSGGSAFAAAGALSIMVGGKEPAFERVLPILECYGKTIVYVGDHGAGQVAKACNQICSVVHQLAAAEAMLLAERSGVNPAKVLEAMMGGFAASRMLEMQAPKMIARDFDGKVESRLHDKDIRIVLEMASALGIDLPTSSASAAVFGRLQAAGGARVDSAAVFAILDGSF